MVLTYAGDYDKIEKSDSQHLKSPILAITGSLDGWAVESALHFFTVRKINRFNYIYIRALIMAMPSRFS